MRQYCILQQLQCYSYSTQFPSLVIFHLHVMHVISQSFAETKEPKLQSTGVEKRNSLGPQFSKKLFCKKCSACHNDEDIFKIAREKNCQKVQYFRVGFHCRVLILTCVYYMQVHVTRVNEVETSYELFRLNVKLNEVQL